MAQKQEQKSISLKTQRLPKNNLMVKSFAEAKLVYAYAKATEELLNQKVQALNAPLHIANDQGTLKDDDWAEQVTANEFKLKLPQAQEALRKAENIVFAVAKELMRRVANAEQWREMAIVFDVKQNWAVRAKVLDLALTWDPTL
jgi:hypothetical protein